MAQWWPGAFDKMHVLQLSLLHRSGLRCEWLHDRLGIVFCIFCTCSLSTLCTRRHQSNDGITHSSFMQFTMSADSVLSVLPLSLSCTVMTGWSDCTGWNLIKGGSLRSINALRSDGSSFLYSSVLRWETSCNYEKCWVDGVHLDTCTW